MQIKKQPTRKHHNLFTLTLLIVWMGYDIRTLTTQGPHVLIDVSTQNHSAGTGPPHMEPSIVADAFDLLISLR